MTEQAKAGQIVTFYSFKGGVGRTMAMANIAFLAARSGLKVLMMDWDLEAPGLEYYFRGMRPPLVELQEKPQGILDVLWHWRSQVASRSSDGVRELVTEFDNGKPFAQCIRQVVEEQFIPEHARLDFVGSGSGRIATPELLPYGEALAKFSWTSFFEHEAGGIVIGSLRRWAKSNYDLVLIDSRTGLSDVAGLCTMQLPDQVALCFILNRQNIDGAAQVAATIKAKRGNDIRVRAVPMRVAGRQTSEESDARARAAAELCDVGGLAKEQVELDLKLLAVAQADNVPFYEALAPFMGTRAAYDPLTLNYARLGFELTGHKLPVLEFDDALVDMVRGRLQPKTATIDYIRELAVADPTRAGGELRGLLVAVEQARESGVLPSEAYVRALVDTIFAVERSHLDLEDSEIHMRAIELVRRLHVTFPQKWAGLLIRCLEYFLNDEGLLLDDEDELALLLELNALLTATSAPDARRKRVGIMRRIGWYHFLNSDNGAALRSSHDLALLIQQVRTDEPIMEPSLRQMLLAAEIDLCILQGDVNGEIGNSAMARQSYGIALDRASHVQADTTDEDLRSLVAQIHHRFALRAELGGQVGSKQSDLASHALDVLRWSERRWFASFLPLARVVIDNGDQKQISEVCHRVYAEDRRAPLGRKLRQWGRLPKQAVDYLQLLCQLISMRPGDDGKQEQELLMVMADSATQLLRTSFRRMPLQRDPRIESIDDAIAQLQTELRKAGVDWSPPPRGAHNKASSQSLDHDTENGGTPTRNPEQE
jgi:hypothetical protein